VLEHAERIEALLQRFTAYVDNLVDKIEQGANLPELTERLAKRRAEKRHWTEEVERLQRANENRRPAPTEQWVDEQLLHLGNVLSDHNPAAARALRDLVSGKIVVNEVRQPGRERHYLQGRFTLHAAAIAQVLVGTAGETAATDAGKMEGHGEEIVIDFRRPPQYEEESERAKALFDQGWLMIRIAREMGKAKSHVTKLIKHWFESRGLAVPDGRSRRGTLTEKNQAEPLYHSIADSAQALWDEPYYLSAREIGRRLGCTDTTAWKAIVHWYGVRQLPLPTTEERRQRIMQRARQMFEENIEIKDIAKAFGYSPRGMKLALKENYTRSGKVMPDGRSPRNGCKRAG
jgi:AraC-like DNA-binding protein